MCTNSGEYPTCMAMAAEMHSTVEENFTWCIESAAIV
jgi:hypothetical protein